jgi:diguanylate cyclase (GGDEF)-like protein
MVGTHAFEWVHPDDHAQAATAIAASVTIAHEEPGRAVLAPVPYRLRSATGQYEWFEVAGRPHPEIRNGELVIAVMRDISRQQHLVHTIELIAAAAPLDSTIEELLHGIDTQRPRRTSGISWTDRGRRRVSTLSLPIELAWSDHPEDPWALAMAEGKSRGFTADDLRPELRALALECGLVTCAVVPVPDPAASEDACLVMWADHAAVAESLQVRAHQQANSLLRLALAQRHERRQLVHAASHDALTGLLNRRALLQRLHDLEGAGVPVSLLFCDLDEFKPVNDDFGHETGDRVLAVIGERLAAAVRTRDLVGRIGGDEFAIAAVNRTDVEQVMAIAERVLTTVGQPLAIDVGGAAAVVRVGISVGIAIPDPPGPRSPDALLAAADDAMYAAKRAGRSRWHLAMVPAPDA